MLSVWTNAVAGLSWIIIFRAIYQLTHASSQLLSASNSLLGHFRPEFLFHLFFYIGIFKGTLYGLLLSETQIQTVRWGNQHPVCQSHTIKPKCLLFPGVISHIYCRKINKPREKQTKELFGIQIWVLHGTG